MFDLKLSRRSAWMLLLLGLGLFLGFLFRAFIIANVVVPIAMVVLMFWRLLLSVHQAIYWGAVIALAVGLAFYRLFQVVGYEDEPPAPAPNSVLKDINYWRLSLQLASDGGPASTGLKSGLRSMLIAVYAGKQPEATYLTIHDALRSHQVPLPDTLHHFLFSDEQQGRKPSWRERLRNLAAKPGKWIRHLTGRDRAEYYKIMEDTLTFMETLMEIKHGNDYFDPPKH